jgi:prepilin peptidase CpaA
VEAIATEIYPFLLATLVAAALFDCRSRRIPNWLSLSGWLIAPLLYLFLDGFSGLQASGYGLALTLLLTFPLFAIGWMGAGDVKLMAAAGAYVGIEMALPLLLGILISGGVLALAVLAWRHSLSSSLSRISASVGLSVAAKKAVYIGSGEGERQIILPYAIPILVGTLLTLFTMNYF